MILFSLTKKIDDYFEDRKEINEHGAKLLNSFILELKHKSTAKFSLTDILHAMINRVGRRGFKELPSVKALAEIVKLWLEICPERCHFEKTRRKNSGGYSYQYKPRTRKRV